MTTDQFPQLHLLFVLGTKRLSPSAQDQNHMAGWKIKFRRPLNNEKLNSQDEDTPRAFDKGDRENWNFDFPKIEKAKQMNFDLILIQGFYPCAVAIN